MTLRDFAARISRTCLFINSGDYAVKNRHVVYMADNVKARELKRSLKFALAESVNASIFVMSAVSFEIISLKEISGSIIVYILYIVYI